MRTKIHTTKKLEKLVKKLIVTDQNHASGILGKWNATVFYVDRKKCWLVTNALTQYNLILPDVKASDLNSIESIFKNALYEQLGYDGIKIDFESLDAMIGGLDLLPTDNDRSTTGFQNQRIYELGYYKEDLVNLEILTMRVLAHRMNTCPIHIGKNKRMSDFTYSVREMGELLTSKSVGNNLL